MTVALIFVGFIFREKLDGQVVRVNQLQLTPAVPEQVARLVEGDLNEPRPAAFTEAFDLPRHDDPIGDKDRILDGIRRQLLRESSPAQQGFKLPFSLFQASDVSPRIFCKRAIMVILLYSHAAPPC
jgi:hypothetical protein